MKNLSYLLGLVLLVLTSYAQAQNKTVEGNAIPYPLEQWNGVKGKTLADSKPDFVGPKKADTGKFKFTSGQLHKVVFDIE